MTLSVWFLEFLCGLAELSRQLHISLVGVYGLVPLSLHVGVGHADFSDPFTDHCFRFSSGSDTVTVTPLSPFETSWYSAVSHGTL